MKPLEDVNGEATIAQELKNGMYFDAISECVQYVEDLFALIKASQQSDYFIRNIITYKAVQVSQSISNFKVNRSSIVKAFHIPVDISYGEGDDEKTVEEGIQYLQDLILKCIQFYEDYQALYNQYKHGLTVGMRPYGNTFSEEQILKDKNGTMPPYLTIYDNIDIQKALQGKSKNFQGMLMPYLTKNVIPFISELNRENNFLRLVPMHDSDIDIERFVDFAYKVRTCLDIFIYNYTFKLKPDPNCIKFCVPSDYRTNMVLNCEFPLND